MTIYNKLVRDKIPQIIEKTGKSFKTTILSDKEFITELKKKSFEELEEYSRATKKEEALEELADVMEVLYALVTVHGSTIEEIETIRQQKAEKRGGFQEKIFLIEVEDGKQDES